MSPRKKGPRQRLIEAEKAEAIRAKNKIQYEKTRFGSFENRLRDMIYGARKRTRRDGGEFGITADDFEPVTHCPLSGIALNFCNRTKGPAKDSPTIDRIDPSKGYVPGNVWVISHYANRIKSDATLEDLEMIVANLRKKIESLKG